MSVGLMLLRKEAARCAPRAFAVMYGRAAARGAAAAAGAPLASLVLEGVVAFPFASEAVLMRSDGWKQRCGELRVTAAASSLIFSKLPLLLLLL